MLTLYKRERAHKKNHCVKQELEKYGFLLEFSIFERLNFFFATHQCLKSGSLKGV